MRHLFVILLVALAGCSSVGTYGPPPNTHLDHDPRQPLFAQDGAAMSDQEIARVLDTRLAMPERFRIGLVYLSHERREDGRRLDAGDGLNWPVVAAAFVPVQEQPRVYDVSYLPQLLLPGELDTGNLRAAAARYQADWVLVFETGTTITKRTPFMGKDKARAFCTAECTVLDVRTGLIVFSARSKVSLTRGNADDEWSLDETVGALEQAAVEEAMGQNTRRLVTYLGNLDG